MLLDKTTEERLRLLRAEAADARACFRTLATQAMVFATAGVALILTAMAHVELAALATVGVMVVVMSVERIGIHKFSTANRIYAYELHLERLDPTATINLGKAMGWEEACRAWRIVQAGVFAALYREPWTWIQPFPFLTDLMPWFYRRDGKHLPRENESDLSEYWWLQAERVRRARGHYHAGSYLSRMFGILEVLEFFCVLPLVLPALKHRNDVPPPQSARWLAAIAALSLVAWLLNRLSLRRRREILENEILSIHSSAIMWKAVAMAHVCAWGTTQTQRRKYTERLTNISRWFAHWPEDLRRAIDAPVIDEWMATGEPNKIQWNDWLATIP